MNQEEVRQYLKDRSRVPDREYGIIREWSIRPCHDTIIYVPKEERILLAIRGQEPAKGFVWPFGGGQKLGHHLEESLVNLIGKESGLSISEVQFFGRPTDHMWSVGPEGTPVQDSGNYYTSIGAGEIRPDRLHSTKLVGPDEYLDIRDSLPHWTRVGMDEAMGRFFGIDVGDKTPFPNYYVDAEPFS